MLECPPEQAEAIIEVIRLRYPRTGCDATRGGPAVTIGAMGRPDAEAEARQAGR